MERADHKEARIRDAIAKTARTLVNATSSGPAPMTHDQAQRRVLEARKKGEINRSENP